MTVNAEIPAGTLICFSSGEYSDFGYNGHFLLLEALTNEKLQEVKDEAKAKYSASKQAWSDWYASDKTAPYPEGVDAHEAFVAGLIRRGVLLPINVHELHLGSYGELDIKL